MEVLENIYASITLESGNYDHAIRVRWKTAVTTAQYLEVMEKVLNLFLEHPSFSMLIMDNTLLPDLAAEAFRWTRERFVSALQGQVTQAVLHFGNDLSSGTARRKFVEYLETQGVVVQLTQEVGELDTILSEL